MFFLKSAIASVLLLAMLLGGLIAVAPAQENEEQAEATATPTPTPTPEEEEPDASENPPPTEAESSQQPAPTPKPTRVFFLPPLSLNECLSMIDRIEKALPKEANPDPESMQYSPETLRRMVRSCYNYLNYRDDLHSSLSDYRWIWLNSGTVESTGQSPDKDLFVFDPPIERISALSLETRRGDTYIHQIRVFDEKDKLRDSWVYSESPRLLRHSLPRRQVYHLWRRTTISLIEIEYSRAMVGEDYRPLVIIYGGITDDREYIKTAIYYLDLAARDVTAQKWPQAREDLLEAREKIEEYLEDND